MKEGVRAERLKERLKDHVEAERLKDQVEAERLLKEGSERTNDFWRGQDQKRQLAVVAEGSNPASLGNAIRAAEDEALPPLPSRMSLLEESAAAKRTMLRHGGGVAGALPAPAPGSIAAIRAPPATQALNATGYAAAPTKPVSAVSGGFNSGVGATLMSVSLTFKGKKKVVRHLKSTTVAEFTDMYAQRIYGNQPLVALDTMGVEVGKELTLGHLLADSNAPEPLQLVLETDAW